MSGQGFDTCGDTWAGLLLAAQERSTSQPASRAKLQLLTQMLPTFPGLGL